MHRLFKAVILIIFLLFVFPHTVLAGNYDGQYKGYAEISQIGEMATDILLVKDSKFTLTLDLSKNWAEKQSKTSVGWEFNSQGSISGDGRVAGNITGEAYVGNTENNAKWYFKAIPSIIHCLEAGGYKSNCDMGPIDVKIKYTKVESLTDQVNPTYTEIAQKERTDYSTPTISKVMGDVQVINPDTAEKYSNLDRSIDAFLGIFGYRTKEQLGPWGEGQKGMQLPLNSEIKIGTGRAIIEFADGTKFVIRENSKFRIFNGGFEIERGGFYMKFEKQVNGKIIIKDKRSLFGVIGTKLFLGVGEESTTLTVFEGLVEASTLEGKSKQNISAGQSIKVESSIITKNEGTDITKAQKEWEVTENEVRVLAAKTKGKTFTIPTMVLGFVLGIMFILGILTVFKNRVIGIIILVLSVGLGSYLLGAGQRESNKNEEPMINKDIQISASPIAISSTPVPTVMPTLKKEASSSAETSNWKTYTDKNLGFTVKHPENVKPENYKDGTFVLSLWGPKQTEDTEFFDGIDISIARKPLAGKTLTAVVEENRTGSAEIAGETISPATQITLGGVNGLTYKAMNNDYYFLPLANGFYLEILNLSADPGNLGYLNTATIILKSLEINK
jgi:hypothetical protein